MKIGALAAVLAACGWSTTSQDLEPSFWVGASLLTPMRVVEALSIEVDEAREQAFERFVRGHAERPVDQPERGGQVAGAKRRPRYDAEAAAAALQRPEQVRIASGVDRADRAVGRHAPDPDAALTAFLESTYAAAADLGRWDRRALERVEGPIGHPPDGV